MTTSRKKPLLSAAAVMAEAEACAEGRCRVLSAEAAQSIGTWFHGNEEAPLLAALARRWPYSANQQLALSAQIETVAASPGCPQPTRQALAALQARVRQALCCSTYLAYVQLADVLGHDNLGHRLCNVLCRRSYDLPALRAASLNDLTDLRGVGAGMAGRLTERLPHLNPEEPTP
jgi:hypothetical protein